MNLLMVSSYPPMACGIGKYAALQVDALRRAGHRVDVLCPQEGDGDFGVDLLGGMNSLRLLKYAWAYDEIYIHFVPFFYYEQASKFSRLATSLAFVILGLFIGPRMRFVIHETAYKLGEDRQRGLRRWLDRWYWLLARRIVFHSMLERETFCEFYGFDPKSAKFEICPQDQYLVSHCNLTQPQARAALGLKPDGVIMLCIGFIQPHKGFDRPMRAMAQVTQPEVYLKVVGSVRLEWDEAHRYAQMLYELADADPRCEVIEGYQSDETFDMWLMAADVVIIPYHTIWTSAVAARAKLYNRPIIAANTGGLAEQLTPGSLLFDNDEQLGEVMQTMAGRVAQGQSPLGAQD